MAFKETEKKNQSNEKTDSELLRRFKANPFVFIGSLFILVIVVVVFLVPSSMGMDSGRRDADLTFGYYDKVPVSYVPGNYFSQYYNMVSQYRQNTMDDDNFSFANYQIWRESFEAAAVHTAMLREMSRSGYAVPAKTVDREVAKLPYFQENGRFSATLYRRMDENRRLTLWRQIQDDITKDRFRSDVTGLIKPAAESEFIGKMAALQRSFKMVFFDVDSFPEQEYESYLFDHPELFRTIHLSMVTISSNEREAQKILASIQSGETTFEDTARAHSKDVYADRGGDMGIKTAQELSIDIPEETIREKMLSLERGEYSDVMKTASGWVFFRAEDSVQEADDTDPAVLDKVRSYIRNFERGRMEDWAIGQADDFILQVNDTGFEEVVAKLGLESRTFGPVPINYGNADLFPTLSSQSVNELSGAATDDNFWKTAFSTPVNTPSRPVVRGSNVLVLFPTEETEADEETVERIASTYKSYWFNNMLEQSLQRFILNSPKMEDKFIDTYFRLFMP